MYSGFDNSACSSNKFGIVKPMAISLEDESSRDSGFGDEDIYKCTFAFSEICTPTKSSSFKLTLNLGSSRSLNFDSPDFSFSDEELANSSSPTDWNTRRCVGRKRPSPIIDDDQITPLPPKRFRRNIGLDLSNVSCVSALSCDPETENHIQSTLDRISADTNLISDGSKICCLPTIPGKHQDLKSISPETLSKVLNNEYDDVIGEYLVVDCRYPYEFDGGHIKDAKNLYTRELITEQLIEKKIKNDDPKKRTVLVFHCEFSSERGPKLSRFLRSMDRQRNADSYPFLFYPEVYILHGGYKDFFNSQKDCCTPKHYVPMHQWLQRGFEKV